MRYMATIYISDVLDQVAATVAVQGWEGQFGPPEDVYTTTVVWPGIGEDDTLRWLITALSELLQDSRTATKGRVS